MIIVVCPVKNEEWILDSFLRCCSRIADAVIIADQGSQDRTKEIAKAHSNVFLVDNLDAHYDEESRSQLLFSEVRKRFGLGNLVVALDADELPIVTKESIIAWDEARHQPLGTVVRIKKPDLLPGGCAYIDIPDFWPIGYVDDGVPLETSLVHARRVPVSDKTYDCRSALALHINLVRPNVLRAKRRMYCVLEAINDTCPLFRRIVAYDRNYNFEHAGNIYPVPVEWRALLLRSGLDLSRIPDSIDCWQNHRTRELIVMHGARRFYLDDIWDVDWNADEFFQREDRSGLKPITIIAPLGVLDVFRKFVRLAVFSVRKTRNFFSCGQWSKIIAP